MYGDFVLSVVGDIDDHGVTFINLHSGTWDLAIHSCDACRKTVACHICGLNLHVHRPFTQRNDKSTLDRKQTKNFGQFDLSEG